MNNKPYPTILQAIGLAVLFILFNLIIGVPVMLIKAKLHIESQTISSLFVFVAYINSIIPVIWIGFLKLNSNQAKAYTIKFNKAPWPVILTGIVLMICIAVITDPLTVLFPVPDSLKKVFQEMSAPNVFAFITAVVAAPLLEEILFRGIILNGLLKNYSPKTAILVSAALFSLVHLNPWQAIPAFLGGALMGWLYYKTNSIIPGMILHFSNNLLATLIGLKYPNFDTLNSVMSLTNYALLLVATLALAFALVKFLQWYFYTHQSKIDTLGDEINL